MASASWNRLGDALPWGAVLLACLPLLVGGFPAGHDWTFELTRDWAYGRALAAGQVPPHWASDLYWGCGSPVFLFYPPLFAALASVLSFATGSVALGASTALVALTAVGAVGAMRVARAAPEGTRAGARVAAYLLVLSPYLIGDALIRNACAEYAALCLMPVALEGLLVVQRRPRRGVVLLAAGVALVMLAHNLMGLVLVVGLVAGAAGLGSSGRGLVSIAAGIGLGLVMSSFYWVPALVLTPWVQTGDLLAGKLDFHANFHPLTELLAYELFFAAGLLPAAVWAGAAVVAVRYRGPRRVLACCLAAVITLVLLQLRISAPLWEAVSTLAYFQFPWRFMGPLAVVTALAGGVVFSRLSRDWPRRAVLAAEVAVLLLCAANALPHLRQYGPLEPAQLASFEASLNPGVPAEHRVTLNDEFLPRGAVRDSCAADQGFDFPGLETVDGQAIRRAPRSRRVCAWISAVGVVSLLSLGLLPRSRRRQSS